MNNYVDIYFSVTSTVKKAEGVVVVYTTEKRQEFSIVISEQILCIMIYYFRQEIVLK